MTRYDPFAKNSAKTDSTRVVPPRHEEDMLFATDEPVKGGPPADSSWDLLNEDVDSLLPHAGALRDAELFAAEILGEETAAPAQQAQPQKTPEPAAPPRETPKPTPAQKPAQPQKPAQAQKPTPAPKPTPAQKPIPAQNPTQAQKPAQAPKQVAPAPRGPAPSQPVRTLPAAAAPRVAVRTLPAAEAPAPAPTRPKTSLEPLEPPRRQPRGASKHAPSIVFGVGASVGGCLALVQHNYVLAAIVGCATLVGVVFTWLWNRR